MDKLCNFKELAPILTEYIRIIKLMQTSRQCFNLKSYEQYNKTRTQLHDKILKLAHKDREDKDFEIQLAMFVEDLINL